jgi:hypothetical protein
MAFGTLHAAWLLLLASALLRGATYSAHAQTSTPPDRPLLLPTRDVDVTYEMSQDGRTLSQRMRWSAAPRKLRVDPPLPGLFVIVDYDQKRMSMVRERERTVIDMTASQQFVSGIEGRLATAARQGEYRVSGLPCTTWETKDITNNPASACITPDGVLLQVRARGQVVLTASSVRYEPQDPALFRVPEGYLHASPDSLPRMPVR